MLTSHIIDAVNIMQNNNMQRTCSTEELNFLRSFVSLWMKNILLYRCMISRKRQPFITDDIVDSFLFGITVQWCTKGQIGFSYHFVILFAITPHPNEIETKEWTLTSRYTNPCICLHNHFNTENVNIVFHGVVRFIVWNATELIHPKALEFRFWKSYNRYTDSLVWNT